MLTAGRERDLKSKNVLHKTTAKVINILIAYYKANKHLMKKIQKYKALSKDEKT